MKKTIYPIIIVTLLLLVGCSDPGREESNPDLTSLYQTEAGKPVNMMLTVYKTTLLANGVDETRLRIAVTDSVGREITTINVPVKITLTGNATILGMQDGSRVELLSNIADTTTWGTNLVDGTCWLRLRSGITPGIIKVEASLDSIWPASHEIHTIPAETEILVPEKNQIRSTQRKIDRMVGADISFLPQIESRGMSFFENGVEKDIMDLLADHGFNYIRLRLFVNPENEKGYSPEKGFCGLDSTKLMARRAREAGMKLLLNFHYSDYWADPQKQNKPKAWENLDFEALKKTLKEYTKSVINDLIDQGTRPEMVQIGNEINHGILWPDGHVGNLDNLAGLLKAGVEAVREVDPSIVVMMHIALGGQNEEAVFWLDNMIARGVEFDIIGLSYYPRWHGTLDDLYANLSDLTSRYQKDVNVVEYSPYKREVHDIVFNLPTYRGKGTCIWEPLNTWSRMFDREGNAMDEIFIYDEIREKYLITYKQ